MEHEVGIRSRTNHDEPSRLEQTLSMGVEGFEKGTFYMTDISIRHAAQDTKEIRLNTLPAIVLKIEPDNLLRVEAMPPVIGKRNGFVELPFDTVKCILSIDTEDDYMGHTFITKVDLDNVIGNRVLKHRFDRQLVTTTNSPSHLVSFTVTRVSLDQAEPQCGEEGVVVSAENNPSGQLAVAVFLLAGDTDPDMLGPKLLNVSGDVFLARFDKRREKHDLDCSIRSYNLAVHMLPSDHLNRPDYQFDTATAYYNRFKVFKENSDIDRAQLMFESAINGTPEDHPKLPYRLWIQGLASQARFEYTYLGDLSSAIASHRRLMELFPESDADFPAILNNLGLSLKGRFELSGDITDVSEAISLIREAIQLLTAGDRALPAALHNLGLSLQLRFKQGGDITDLSEAISSFRDAIKYTPPADTEDLLTRKTSLAVALQLRFENSDEATDMSEAILLLQTVIKLTPKGHDKLSVRLGNLGLAMLCRFNHATGGKIPDLSEAISSFQQAIELTPSGDGILPARLNNLGNALRQRFDRSTNPEDLSKAVSLHRRAIELSTADSKDLHSWFTNLGVVLNSCFGRTGDIGELSEAISSFRKAVILTPPNNPCLPRRLNNLGCSLVSRFERSGVLEELSEAITLLRKAVDKSSDTHYASLDVAAFIDNLSLALQQRFEFTRDIADLSEAISQQHRAIEFTPPGHAYLPLFVGHLGVFLLDRFKHSKDMKDVSEAITSFQEAVRHSHGRSSLPVWLNNLALAFRNRFELTGNIADLSEAISSQEEAIQLTPEGHSDLSHWHNCLGRSMQVLYTRTNDNAHIASAISHYRQAATLNTGIPFTRIIAARKWAQCSQQYDSSQSLEAYGVAINLLSEFAGMNEPVEARHTSLGSMSNLISAAAATAFSFGRIELALEWLEQGRCIVWTQLSQLRNPLRLHDLRAKHADLAERLQQVSSKLEKAGSRDLNALATTKSPEKKVSLEEEAIEHIKLAKEWNQLLEEIRREPGFSNFLRPRKFSEILPQLPQDGSVVLINVHERQSHALALIPSCNVPVVIQLQSISDKWVLDIRSRLVVCLSAAGVGRGAYRAARPKMKGHSESIRDILRALWIDLVKPILDAIGYHEPSQSHRRIWWCPTGPLAFLPIHAAGIYEEGGICVSDFAISSYIPKIETLIEKSKKKEAAPRILLVSQAKAPGLPQILGADKETKMLLELVQGCGLEVLRLSGDDATVKRMEEEMPSYRWIHLACHATQEVLRPMKSAFHLLDGDLDLSEIIKLQIPNADFAFLSACQTSTGDSENSDEAVHLAGGMLVAGYRSVISTMWSIKDEYGSEVAESFYSFLLKKGNDDKIQWDGAAHAIHHATQYLRKKLGDTDESLLTWVPYVHFGI